MNDRPIDLSIVIPAYMEASVIGDTLDKLADFLKTRQYGVVEVVVVVADSPDGTAELAQKRAHKFDHFKVVHAGPRVGKGRDVRLGMFEARGAYKLFMDADLATPLHHLDDVKRRVIDTHSHVGIAVRDLVSTHHTLIRKIITRGGNLVIQAVLLPGVKDTQCGFKVFQAGAAEEIFSRITILGWGFDLEVLAIARMLRYNIVTFEAPDWRDPKEHDAGLVGDSASSAGIQVLFDVFSVRLRLWLGRYAKPNYVHNRSYS